MKKHPIDELFARKLAEHRQEPSQKAFEKFQARLQEKQTKRRGGVFAINRNWAYYAAAAGVVAVLTIGVLSQNNTGGNNLAANNTSSKKVEAVKQPLAPEGKENKALIARAENNTPELGSQATAGKITVAQNKAAITNKETVKLPAPEDKVIIDTPQAANALASNAKDELKPLPLETLAGKNTIALKEKPASAASKYHLGESVTLIVTPIEDNSLAALNESNNAQAEEKAEKDKSFLAKLYGEYKNFKYGEKVDLKRIGVKDAVARVDEGLFKEEREDVRDFVQRRIVRMQKREEDFR
ncbi:hypothetical protein [Emticicia sp. 21SJ11W-3]|uniref:hypothetical protein n=1 Tax=Emticicia sp. 21SJ11W-3 TaxID=2916755 RepID=UPI00209D7D5D|nr:hypothetical protein [Emticicia sp. 21SJ11W-3]UTA67303.1 hypothetical protein MB380_17120 [Emticicia sp. 21SJ11W-3]